ncbi:MAG: phage major capsid protein [Desulfovibrio sp.]|nr:phage major capsid protein [Desulfovibrio sp.]
MIFDNVKDAFNYWNGKSVDELEKRAAEIADLVDKDPKADVKALNMELEGIKQAKENVELRSQMKRSLGSLRGSERIGGTLQVEPEDLAATPEYRSAFFKHLLGRDLNETERGVFRKVAAEHRTATFNQTSNSAAILPTQTLNEIVSKARTMGGLLAECRAFNVPANISVPVATPASNAAWHVEGAAVESVNASVSAVSFAGYELLKLFSMSVKVNAMSVPAFESYLVQELTDCIFGQLGYSVINGSGSGQGKGLEEITWNASSGSDGQNAVQGTTKITYADIVEAAGLLKRGYANGAVFACNNKFLYSVLYSMLDKNDRPIFVQDVQREGIGHVLGFPVVIDDNIADDTAYLGNFKFYGYNLADGITIESSRESSFSKGLVDFRAMAVADCKPIVEEAFVKLYLASGGGDDDTTTTDTTTTE